MALSRRDVIITCFVAFVGWAWITHWIPHLRIVPYAFVAGILTVVAGVLYLVLSTSRDKHHANLPPLPRSSYLTLTSPENWHAETGSLQERFRYIPRRIEQDSPLISQRIDELLSLTLRDFVKTWFSKISKGTAFANEVDRAIRASLGTVLEHIVRVDLVEFGVTRLLPIINSHARDFHEAERLVRGKALNLDITETAELDVAIAGRYRDGKLHPAASLAASKTTALQQQHLRRISGRLVAKILPTNITSSSSVLVLIREILACAVLLPVMVLLADPDVLNQFIEAYGRSIWHERKTVRKLREALDKAASPHTKPSKNVSFPKLVPQDSERSFEKFVRAIRQCNSLSDARRFRSEISRQLKRDGAKADRDTTYLRRLDMGRKLLDQKIAKLATPRTSQTHDKQRTSRDGERLGGDPWRDTASLRQVLYDASGLSYFMEFMDRLNLMSLVQFWIVVDGLRNPLDLDPDQLQNSNNNSSSGSWNQSDQQDISQINSGYLSRPELKAPLISKNAVQYFLDAGNSATKQQYDQARQAVLDVQANIFQELKDRHFPRFCKSDLFFKWLASDTPRNMGSNSAVSDPSKNIQSEIVKPPVQQLKDTGLRRSIASSSDLAGATRISHEPSEPRRSLDDTATRNPLFDDDQDDDPLAKSTRSLESFDSPMTQSNGDRKSMIDAVQAALDDLVDENGEDDLLAASWNGPDGLESPSEPFDYAHSAAAISITEKGKPSLSSLGLVGTPTKPTVFSQGDLFGENDKLGDDENDEDDANGKPEEDIHEAAPGDLGLSELVHSMTLDIDRLEAQQAIVDSLTRKAELTNNSAELRILRKSKTSLEREIHRKELQRQQYIIQRGENDLYGKANVAITSIMVGNDSDGHEFALYVVEIQRNSADNAPAVTWAIARRYSEFHELHRQLRSKFPDLKDLDFPRRQMVVTLQRDFLKKRRAALEKYLRELLARPAVCRSLEFRAFLSQQTIRPISDEDGHQLDREDLITRIYHSVTDGMEEFLGNIPVLDQLSTAGQNLITAATSVSASGQLGSVPALGAVSHNPTEVAEAQAEIAAFEITREAQTVSFIKPICDIFVEIFQLNQGNNWLRGRAVVMVIQQLLGGTIERKVRDAFKAFTTQDSISRSLDHLKEIMWPGGVLRSSPPVRTEAEKSRSRKEARLVLATLLPDLAGGVVGRGNAAKAGEQIFATLNNERLNEHLLYTLLDEIIDGIFGVRVIK